MPTIFSKPLTSSQLQSYQRLQQPNPQRAYYTEGQELQGYWHGQLAEDLGLVGAVHDEHFDRLAEGKDPFTGDQLIRYRAGKAVTEGREVEHRAGYDLMFSPGKSISVTAIVGGDERIFKWHRDAVREAADFGEKYTQARMGGNRQPLTTGKWIAAGFEHDTSRPVDGYAAPQLHTHLVVFNLTAPDANGRARAIQPKELYNLQAAMTRVYQNRLAMELRRGGYELERGKNHAPEIKGYSKEYLEAESPRREQIMKEMERLGYTSRKASDIIAHQDREGKLGITPLEMHRLHRAHGEQFGQPTDEIIRQAKGRERTIEFTEESPKRSVDFAIRKLSERQAVIERDGYKQFGGIIQNALTYSQGRVTLKAIEQEIERRKELTDQDRANGLTQPELTRVSHYRTNAPGERYATREMLATEREMMSLVMSRQGIYDPIAQTISRDEFRRAHEHHMTGVQMHMVWDAMHSRDQVFGIQGAAGAGKSHSLKIFAGVAEDHGYQVRGLAPTSTARKELERLGISASTLAKHNASLKKEKPSRKPVLYLLDESSLAGAKQVHKFLTNLRPNDRAVLVGDTKQHDSIDAGRIFAQLQTAGMRTIGLERIMRQRENPDLLEAVRYLQRGNPGDVGRAVAKLTSMDVVHQVTRREKRFEAIAKQFAASPLDTIAISPDNRSRAEINSAIRKELKAIGIIGEKDFSVSTLVSRNDLYQEDARLVGSYDVGNWIRVGKSEPLLKVRSGDYLQVQLMDTEKNILTVATTDGRSFEYNPEKLNLQPSIFRVETRDYAVGDRIQLTSQWKQQGLANRERGTIESLDAKGNAELRMEEKDGKAGRLIRFNLRDFSHIDHGYSSTSFSSQSMTMRNVLVHIDTGDGRVQSLLDRVLAYVAASRASHELHFYTDDKSELTRTLDRLEIRPTAVSIEETMLYRRTA